MSRFWSAKFHIAAALGLFIVGAAYAVPPGTNDEIAARLAPFGSVR